MVTAWMASAGHRENLLSGDYTEVGLGLALGTPADRTWGATYTTDFGAGAQAPAPARVKEPARRARRARRPSSAARVRSRGLGAPQRALREAARVDRLRPLGARRRR